MSCTKERILAIERILTRRGSCSMAEILSDLREEYGIEADRRRVHDDINALTKFYAIDTVGFGRSAKYFLKKL